MYIGQQQNELAHFTYIYVKKCETSSPCVSKNYSGMARQDENIRSKNDLTEGLHTKTVMPCSLQSIAAAHSKRLTTTHWRENLSSLSLPENTKPRPRWSETGKD